MKRAVVNNIPVFIASPADPNAQGFQEFGTISYRVGDGSKRDLVRASGIDESKIDYAIPQDWVDENAGKYAGAIDDILAWTVWSYESSSIFGEPLDLRSFRRIVINLAIEQVLA